MCPSPLKPGGTPTVSQELAGQQVPPGSWEEGRWLSLGSIQTQGVSKVTQLPASRMGELGGFVFHLNLLHFIPQLKQPWFPEKDAGRRRRQGGVALGTWPLCSRCGLSSRISWEAQLLVTLHSAGPEP